MQNIPTKSPGDKFFSAELNSMNNELQNLIINGGIPLLSAADLNQLGKAIANIVGSVNFYSDTGATDAYVLNVTGTFQAPTVYTIGMLVRFRPTNDNTGASTINVSSLGIKDIKKEDGTTDVEAGDISTIHDAFLRYDGTSFISVGNTFNNLITNNLIVNTLLKTVFAGTPTADQIEWVNVLNNVQDLANTGYGVGRRFNLSDADPTKSAGIAGFAETNNAASVALGMWLKNAANFLKVGQLRAPAGTDIGIGAIVGIVNTIVGEETFLEAENFGNFIVNHTTFTAGGEFIEWTFTGSETGIMLAFAENEDRDKFEASIFLYGGTTDTANLLSLSGGIGNASLITTAFQSTVAGLHTVRITSGAGGNVANGNVYVVKIPMHAGTKL